MSFLAAFPPRLRAAPRVRCVQEEHGSTLVLVWGREERTQIAEGRGCTGRGGVQEPFWVFTEQQRTGLPLEKRARWSLPAVTRVCDEHRGLESKVKLGNSSSLAGSLEPSRVRLLCLRPEPLPELPGPCCKLASAELPPAL